MTKVAMLVKPCVKRGVTILIQVYFIDIRDYLGSLVRLWGLIYLSDNPGLIIQLSQTFYQMGVSYYNVRLSGISFLNVKHISVGNYLGPIEQSVSAVGSESEGRSSCREFDPGTSHKYFRGDYDHEIISSVILLLPLDPRRVVSCKRSMCMKYWLTALSSLPRIKCGW